MPGRILVVDYKTPRPDEDSGSASAFSYLQILSRGGFDVTFLPGLLAGADRYTQALDNLGIKALSAPEWTSLEAAVRAFAPSSDVVLIYRVSVAAHVFDIVRQAAPTAKIIFHAVDLHFLRMEREAALTGDQALADTASAVRAIELDLISRADASIVVSGYERELLRELVPAAVVHQIPILRETPARSQELARHWSSRRLRHRRGPLGRWLNRLDPGLRRRRDFLFIGGYEHLPNVDAVQWFVREVWPILQSRGFPHRFIIAGSKVPDEIARLASDKIEVRGYVEDLEPLYSACRLSIAPLRYGAGIKGKVVTSLGYGVPVVATSVAAEGAGLRHGENILIADNPEIMAEQIMRLYRDGDLWQQLSANGYETFQAEFSQSARKHEVLDVVQKLMASVGR